MSEEANFWQWVWTILLVPVGWIITRQEKHKEQVNKNAVAIASLKSDMRHVKEKTDETHTDVKKLLGEK